MRTWILTLGGVLTLACLAAVGHTLVLGQNNGGGKKGGKTAKSEIVKVTVYPNSALVTREVDVPAGAGLVELTVSPLPVRVVDSSLYSEGNDGLRILSTRFRTRQVKEASREDVRKIEEEMKTLQQTAQKLQAEVKTLETNMQMLGKIENFTSVTTVHSTKEGGLNSDTVIKLAKYVMEERAEKSKKLVELQQQLQANQEQTTFLQHKLQEVSAGRSRTERDAVITLDRTKGQGGKIRLNYLVDSVSWNPQYKLRAGKVNENVEFDYLAALVQQSGEDWNVVNLTLSTAQPMLNAVPPDLQQLAVTVVARSSVPGMPPVVAGQPGQVPVVVPTFRPQERIQLQRDAIKLRQKAYEYSVQKDLRNNFKAINEAAAKEQMDQLMQTRAELREAAQKLVVRGEISDGPSVTYHLPHRLSVPSRNDEQVIEVAKLKLTPDYYYKAVPVLTNSVYRLADLANKSEYVLLPGEATMYQGADFVGRMRMPLVAIGEKFTVGFGVDPQMQVQRKLMDKSRSTQGGNQVLTYNYRILINSYKKEPVQLQVWDRLPHAESETASITVVKTDPDLSTDPLYLREGRPANLLRWDIRAEPTMHGEKAMAINYEFRLELARDMVISKLWSK